MILNWQQLLISISGHETWKRGHQSHLRTRKSHTWLYTAFLLVSHCFSPFHMTTVLLQSISNVSHSDLHSEYYTLSNFWLSHTRNITPFWLGNTLGILHTCDPSCLSSLCFCLFSIFRSFTTCEILSHSDSVIHSEYIIPFLISDLVIPCHTWNYTCIITRILISDSVTLGYTRILSIFLFWPLSSFFSNSSCTQMTETKTV